MTTGGKFGSDLPYFRILRTTPRRGISKAAGDPPALPSAADTDQQRGCRAESGNQANRTVAQGVGCSFALISRLAGPLQALCLAEPRAKYKIARGVQFAN